MFYVLLDKKQFISQTFFTISHLASYWRNETQHKEVDEHQQSEKY